MAIGNSSRGGPHHFTTMGKDIAAFDRLPAVVRRALREAAINMAAEAVQQALDSGIDPVEVAKQIREADATQVSALYIQRIMELRRGRA